jgi:hypothetical protein
VKLLFFTVNPEETHAISPRKKGSLKQPAAVAELVVTGDLTLDKPHDINNDLGSPGGENDLLDGVPTSRTNIVEDILVTIEVNSIDLSNQKNLYSSNGLFELQCSISMNAQDFASMKESSKEKEKENKEKDPSVAPIEKPSESVPISSL